ncbi:hypothetical protein KM043_009032 [Ampulex compressa]|nr:hypothetical protein KM043_009032 [Ampulex compressa]
MNREFVPLLAKSTISDLSLFFATLCIVDIFGVFPIIALPRAIVQCGLYGIPLVLVVFGLQIYTAALLGKSWIIATALDPQISRKNRYPLAAVTEFTLGPRARTMVTVLLDLTIFGCGIPNLLVASQNLQLFGLKVSGQRFDLSFCYWLLIVGLLLCPLMWLGSPRDMKWLASFSCAAVIVTAGLIWWCVINDDRALDVMPISASPTWDKFISGYGMLAFQFDVHPTLMTVQVDMRQPRDINRAVLISFFISGSLFAVTTGLVVWKYGGSTTANILLVVPGSLAANAAIFLAAIQLCFSSALGHSALFQHLESKWSVERNFGWRRCALRSAIVLLGVAVGESVPRFDIVMALIGGTLTGPLVFVLPPLMHAKARALRSRACRASSSSEIYSGAERRRSVGNVPTRAHSRSIYYGFLGVARSDPGHYSYVYYDDLDEEPDADEDREDGDGDRQALEEILMTRRIRSQEPVLLDAAQPNIEVRGRTTAVEESSSRKILQFGKVLDWFGYLVVVVGIVITVSSTYINVRNTIRYVRFTPPCIVNASMVQSPG